MARFSESQRTIHRIGLISPCSGNLGNAAILSATIANIQERLPRAEIIGITLSPQDTCQRHGIAAFPITGSGRANYSLINDPNPTGTQAARTTVLWQIKEWLKGIRPLRRLVRAIRGCCSELAHIVKSGRLVRTLDCVIVTGGGALDEFWGGPWGHPWTLFKFAVLSRICRVPFLFVSVGKCSLESRSGRFFVRTALRLAQYRSYRDCDSQKAVQAILRSPNDPVYPDLAYSYPKAGLPRPRWDASERRRQIIAVSPIAWCDPRVWPTKNETRYLRYVRELAQALRWLIAKQYEVVLFATDSPDTETIKDLLAIVWRASVDTTLVSVLPGPPMQTTEGLLKGICRADIVIASRLHGVILSHLIGVPVLAISYDRKVDVHMSEIGQSRYCLDIDRVDAQMLINGIESLREDRDRESVHLRRAVDLYRKQVNAQYDLVLGNVRPDRAVEANGERLYSAVQS